MMNKPEKRSLGGAHGAISARSDTSALPSTSDRTKLRRERHVYGMSTLPPHLQAPIEAAWRLSTTPVADESGLQLHHAAPMELGGGSRLYGYKHARPTGPVENVTKEAPKPSYSETLRDFRGRRNPARSWSAPVLWRFERARETNNGGNSV